MWVIPFLREEGIAQDRGVGLVALVDGKILLEVVIGLFQGDTQWFGDPELLGKASDASGFDMETFLLLPDKFAEVELLASHCYFGREGDSTHVEFHTFLFG